jgi:hypothetical protein
MKLTIEGEPKEIAALIFAVSERRVNEAVEAAIQRKAEEFAKALKEDHDRLDSIFRAQQRRVPYD